MSRLPEFDQLNRLTADKTVQTRTLTHIGKLPIYEITLGNTTDTVPTVLLTGGIHGNERIGSQVLLAWLEHIITRQYWDKSLQELLQKVRLVMLPMVNVSGLVRATRATKEGIDLMRNAPVDAKGVRLFPLAGQKLSNKLPWYRGNSLAAENQAILDSIANFYPKASFVISLDFHSGFGMSDRIWFPYAAHRVPPPHLAEAVALCDLFNHNYPFHDYYTIEPQSLHYTAHGDLWDYVYDLYREKNEQESGALFLPFTLEMGSWLWLRKNPRQLFDRLGLFHPVLPHRLRRVLRRHWTLLDFVVRATAEYEYWQPELSERFALHQTGVERWYLQ